MLAVSVASDASHDIWLTGLCRVVVVECLLCPPGHCEVGGGGCGAAVFTPNLCPGECCGTIVVVRDGLVPKRVTRVDGVETTVWVRPRGPVSQRGRSSLGDVMSSPVRVDETLAAIGETVVRDGDEVEAFGLRFDVGEHDAAQEAFTTGACHVFALVAAQETRWPVWVLGASACRGECQVASGQWCVCQIDHFVVRSPDGGRFVDVTGNHDIGVLKDHLGDRVLRPATAEDVDGAMRLWGASPELVGWARLEYQMAQQFAASDDYEDSE